jgi:hypothetical protein
MLRTVTLLLAVFASTASAQCPVDTSAAVYPKGAVISRLSTNASHRADEVDAQYRHRAFPSRDQNGAVVSWLAAWNARLDIEEPSYANVWVVVRA